MVLSASAEVEEAEVEEEWGERQEEEADARALLQLLSRGSDMLSYTGPAAELSFTCKNVLT